MTPILFALLSAAWFYLASRALITRWLWSRYPEPIGRFFDCAACSGFWYGLVLALALGSSLHLTYLGLDLTRAYTWPLVALASIVTTPIAAAIMQWALGLLGSAYTEMPNS